MKLLFCPREEKNWSAERLKYMADAALNAGAVRILDVGSAQVENIYLSRPNLQLFCIDDWEVPPKKTAAEFRKVNIDVDGLPFEPEFFDAVLAGEILEHLWSPFTFLAETNRVLRPGGMLVISTPHPHYYTEILKAILGINRIDCDGHVNLFSRVHLSEVLHKLGFEVVEVKSTCMWIPLVRIVFISPHLPAFLSASLIYVARKRYAIDYAALLQARGLPQSIGRWLHKNSCRP